MLAPIRSSRARRCALIVAGARPAASATAGCANLLLDGRRLRSHMGRPLPCGIRPVPRAKLCALVTARARPAVAANHADLLLDGRRARTRMGGLLLRRSTCIARGTRARAPTGCRATPRFVSGSSTTTTSRILCTTVSFSFI